MSWFCRPYHVRLQKISQKSVLKFKDKQTIKHSLYNSISPETNFLCLFQPVITIIRNILPGTHKKHVCTNVILADKKIEKSELRFTVEVNEILLTKRKKWIIFSIKMDIQLEFVRSRNNRSRFVFQIDLPIYYCNAERNIEKSSVIFWLLEKLWY